MGDQMFWLIGMIGSSIAIIGILAFAYVRERQRREPPTGAASRNRDQR